MYRICDNFTKKVNPELHQKLILMKKEFDLENEKLIKTEGKIISSGKDKEAKLMNFDKKRCVIF